MDIESIDVSILNNYPTVDEASIDTLLKEERKNFNKKIIVLDDDPTGIQTVHDIFVYTDWNTNTIQSGFKSLEEMFFILTNSRSFSKDYTRNVHTQIAERVGTIANELDQDFLIISRGDSTLRGHYPLETETLKNTLTLITGKQFDGEIICPFFMEGGRYTINDIHYVKEQDQLTPAGFTEFAKDKTFGYASSHLGDYIEEKSHGEYKKEECIFISLEEIRGLKYDTITQKLLNANNFNKIIVNAIDYIDLKIFCIAWIRAMNSGKNYIARSAAALPKVIGGISSIPLLSKKDLVSSDETNGGIVIIGSHVQKTNSQIESLMNSNSNLKFIEFNVNSYFLEGSLDNEVTRVLKEAENLILSGTSVVVYTSRTLLLPDTVDQEAILKVSVHISDALTSIISKLSLKPKFIIAKGGITSSDVGTKGLKVKKALVMGQIKKGIPVWMTGEESKFPNTPYIIFPGNVGEADTLREIVEELN